MSFLDKNRYSFQVYSQREKDIQNDTFFQVLHKITQVLYFYHNTRTGKKKEVSKCSQLAYSIYTPCLTDSTEVHWGALGAPGAMQCTAVKYLLILPTQMHFP